MEHLENFRKEYSIKPFKWYQFIKRYQFSKNMKRLTPGARIKIDKPVAFTEDFEINTTIKVRKK